MRRLIYFSLAILIAGTVCAQTTTVRAKNIIATQTLRLGASNVTTVNQLSDSTGVLRTLIQSAIDSATVDIFFDFGTENSTSKQLGTVVNSGLVKFKTLNLEASGGLVVTHGASNTDSMKINIALADNTVTNAKMADMANATIKGRSTAGTGDPEDLTATQVRSLLSLQLPATWLIVEDFVNGAGSNFSGYTGNGGGAFNIPILATDQVGVFRFNTGSTNAAAYSLIATYDNSFTFNSNTYTMDIKDVTINTLNTSTDSSAYIIGFFDNLFSNGDPVDGAYFSYDAGSANWKAVTRSNSVMTQTATDVVVATGIASSVDMEIRATSTQVLFYINGILKATHTTDIPSGLTRTFSMGAGVKKKLGTAERTMEIDRILFKIN